MSKRIVALGTICVLGITVATLRAQTGTIINDPSLDSWSIYGKQTNARLSDAKLPGGAAIEVTLSKKGDNSWDAGAVTDIIQAIHKGDHIHIALPLKGKLLDGSGNVKIDMKLQFNSPPFNSIGNGKTLTLSSDWQTFVLDAVADKDYAPRSTALVMVLATDKQVVDIGQATITDQTLSAGPPATAQEPTGTFINNPDLDGWSVFGAQTNARVSDAKVTGGSAIEVTLPKKGDNDWDAGAVNDVIKPLHKGDRIHIALPLKGKLLDGSGNVKLSMVLRFNSAPYNSIGNGKTITLSSDWQTFVLDTIADKDYAPRTVVLLVLLATDKQVVDIGPATITGESSPGVQAKATGSAAGGLPVPKAFYVAPNGNDHNPGTLEKPVATLARAQQLMRASTAKTTYLRAGVYVLPVAGPKACTFGSTDAGVALTSDDNGETWSFYPPDGYDTAVLDGQSTKGSSAIGGGNGLGCAFAGKSIHDVHIVGLRFKRFLYSAFWVDGGTGLSFADNIVQDLTAAVFSSGGAYGHCVTNSTIRDNAFFDLAYMAVALGADSPCPGGISNDIVSGNFVLNTCLWPAVPGGKGNDQDGGDCGGIYILDRTTASTGVQIVNNFTRDVNIVSKAARDWDNCCAFGIYLDDGASNASVNGNVVAGSMTGCFMIHGGEKNDIRGNLCDLGVEGTQGIVVAGTVKLTKMSGNRFHNNLVVAGSKDPGLGFFYIGDAIPPLAIADNAYFNYAGSEVLSKGNFGSDAHPVYRDPQLSSWTYRLAKDSPIYGAPVSFAGIPTMWGPPGFVIPQKGTPPSYVRR